MKKHLSTIIPAVWLAAALAAVVIRAVLVQSSLGGNAGCSDCLILPALRSDAWLVAWACVLATVFSIARHRSVRLLAVSSLALTVCLMVADVIVFATLSMRLQFSDVAKFGREVPAILDFLVTSSGTRQVAFAGLAVGAACWLAFRAAWSGRPSARGAFAYLVVATGLALFAGLPRANTLSSVFEGTVDNLAQLNLDQGVDRPYSARFSADLSSAPGAAACVDAPQRRPNVVMVVVESLSAYHSARQGGLGWTPELDRIAAQNVWYSDFHANGFTTDHGLIALLTGRVPLPSVGRYGSSKAYAGYFQAAGSIADRMEGLGYSTHFFTTGDLGFLDKGVWLKAIGFDHVEGAEHPFYAGWHRLHFNAAEDQALFLRFDQWRASRSNAEPYFATLLTVSSHPPFLHPTTGERTEESVIRYADAELGRFYDRLERSGFFADGLLIVVGDHRAMSPVRESERERFGDRALSRVQMIVAGLVPRGGGERTVLAQQADLADSLLSWLGPRHCRSAEKGDFLSSDPRAPSYALHVRGDRRSVLNAYFGDRRTAHLHLAGDDTAWVGEPPPDGARILARVNRERIDLGVADQDFVDYLIHLRTGTR